MLPRVYFNVSRLCLGLCAAFLATPLQASDFKTWFVVINAGNGRDVNATEWQAATQQAELDGIVQTVIDTDFYAIDRTIEQAKSEGGGTVVFMMTANLPTTDPADHSRIVENFIKPNPEEPLLEGLSVMMQSPGCALIRKPLTGAEFIHTDTIVTMNDPQARQDCFAASMTFVMNNLDQFGPRTPFDQQIDEGAIARQSSLEPMAIKSKALTDEAARQPDGPPVRRATNIYKPDEKISFHANILNVGRFEPGSVNARYEIRLDIKVSLVGSEEGGTTIPNAHVYKGQSTHRVPVPDDYFDNFITAGFSLKEPGEYLVELVLTDLSRPDQEGTSVAVPYAVVIAQ